MTLLRKAGSGSVDPLIFNDVVDAEQNGSGGVVTAADIDSQAASNGDVLTADGAGNAVWEASAGGVPTSRTLTAGAALTGGGDLSANRTFDVAVDDSTIEVNADALRVKALGITDSQVAAANKDGATGTPSMRTLGTGAQQALPGNTSIPSVPAFATNAVVLGTTAAAGAASTVMRSNDTIAAFDATSPSTQAVGDSAVVGVATVAARRDHKHAMPAFATNALSLGASAAAGSAATLIRSDATIAAFDTTVPTTQAFADAAAIGTAAFAARRDHKHAMPANPVGTSWTTVSKTLDESVTSSTTLQDDDELFFTAASGGFYEYQLFLFYANPLSAGTPDIKYVLGEDNNTVGVFFQVSIATNDVAASGVKLDALSASAVTAGTAAANRGLLAWGVHTGAGGTFKLQWAQNTSDGNPTTVRTGSVIRYRRLV